jgi:hypothetical protein
VELKSRAEQVCMAGKCVADNEAQKMACKRVRGGTEQLRLVSV